MLRMLRRLIFHVGGAVLIMFGMFVAVIFGLQNPVFIVVGVAQMTAGVWLVTWRERREE